MGQKNQPEASLNRESQVERDVLQDYLDDIVDMSVLDPDEQIRLLTNMESAEAALRQSIAEIPETARLLVDRWNDRREKGLVTGALSKWHRDGSNRNCNQLIDRGFKKIERSLETFERSASGEVASQHGHIMRLAECVVAADVSLPLLLEILESLVASKRSLRSRHSKKALRIANESRAQLTDSKNLFISHNLRLVIRCAKNYRNQGVPFLDLIQEGNIGLIRAVEKFDYRRGYKFSTYAIWWIEQSLVRAVASDSRVVRIPSPVIDQRRKLKQIEGAQRALTAGEPTPLDLIESLGIDSSKSDDLHRSLSAEISTQSTVNFSDTVTLEETLMNEEEIDAAYGLDNLAIGRRLQGIIPTLGDREQRVIEARFGLSGGPPKTLVDIGRELGVSRERVRQIERGALEQLRENRIAQSIAAEIGCL